MKDQSGILLSGHELTFNNPDKIYWPVEKISNGT